MNLSSSPSFAYAIREITEEIAGQKMDEEVEGCGGTYNELAKVLDVVTIHAHKLLHRFVRLAKQAFL